MASAQPQSKRTRKTKAQSRRADKEARPLIRCVIFDLDDTLYDCFRQRLRVTHRYAAHAMVEAKDGLKASVEAVYRARMQEFRRDPTLRHIDAAVCRSFRASDPEAISRAAREAYFHCPVGKLTLFPATLPLLRFLHHRGVHIFVVSFGEPEIQHAKIRVLGLDRHPLIDGVLFADREKLLTKEAAFRRIQRRLRLPPEKVLVVGDRPMSEIRAGKDLGMHTVRIRRGEFFAQTPRGPEETADFTVRNISEVKKLPFAWGTEHKLTTKAPRQGENAR